MDATTVVDEATLAACNGSLGRFARFAAALFSMLALVIAQAASAITTTYRATETIPVPPASSYAGPGGGDGWDVSLSATEVFNVFHHDSSLFVACHKQSDATACYPTRRITDDSGRGYASSSHSGTHRGEDGKLWVYATRQGGTAGVVCVDTLAAATDPNPFCGFSELTAVGDGGITSVPMRVGDRLYAFNFVNGSPSGDRDKLLCFDTSTRAACAGQPFTVNIGAGNVSTNTFPVPATSVIGDQLLIPIYTGGVERIACWDDGLQSDCAGSFPLSLTIGYANNAGSPFPMLASSGAVIGFCLPTSSNQCFTLTGASTPTPPNMTTAIGRTTQWDGPALILGSRVYLPGGPTNTVRCYDYSTSLGCANFPRPSPGADGVYTVNADPQRPTCIWLNSDRGSSQIQNFDAFTAGACGQGVIRVLSSRLIVPKEKCQPTAYKQLAILEPVRADYTDGTVAFATNGGNPIPTIPGRPLDGSGAVDLTGTGLEAIDSPQFLITLNTTSTTPTQVIVEVTWEATFDPECFVTPPVCPNGLLEPGEECDDGNGESGDGCSSECKIDSRPCVFQARSSARYGNGLRGKGDLTADPETGLLRLGRHATMADETVMSANRVAIGNGASAFSVSANQLMLGRGAVVRGNTDGPLQLLPEPYCPIPDTVCGEPDVLRRKGSPASTLAPGRYGHLSLENGTTVTLQAGNYEFCSVRTGRHATIAVGGGALTAINVVGDLRLENDSRLALMGDAPTPLVNVHGRRVRLGANGVLDAVLSAPQAKLRIGRGAMVKNGFCVEQAVSGHGVSLECPPRPSSTTSTLVSTTTTVPSTSTTTTSTTTTSTTTTSTTTTSTTTTSTTMVTTSTVTGTTSTTSTTIAGGIVPSLLGLTQLEAETALFRASLVLGQVGLTNAPSVAAGRIAAQTPSPGTTLAAGGAVSITLSVGASIPDGTFPEVTIHSPSFGSTLTSVTDVVATISDSNLAFYQVHVARGDLVDQDDIAAEDPDFELIGEGSVPVSHGVVARFDPSVVVNDSWVIRVRATDTGGLTRYEAVVISVDGQAKLGRFGLEFVDLAIPLVGIPIQVVRRYDSLVSNDTDDFGFGWRLAFADPDLRSTTPNSGGDFFDQTAFVHEVTRVYLTTPDGRRIGFTFFLELHANSPLGPTFRPRFRPDPGAYATLSTTGADGALGIAPDGRAVLFLFGFPWRPENYVLTLQDGTAYRYDRDGEIETITDRSGNVVEFTPTAITHSSGVSVQLQRDAQQRIRGIVDPDGNTITYGYDAAGDLRTVTDAEGNATQFEYFAVPRHYLKEVIDPLGRMARRTEYDEQGRIVAIIDALGNRTEQLIDPGAFTGTITDARGQVTTLLYDGRGNVLERHDPRGGVTRNQYGDARNPDKPTSTESPDGHVTTMTYDAGGHLTSHALEDGGEMTFLYGACDRPESFTDEEGRTWSLEYDAACRLKSSTDPAGATTHFVYGPSGELIERTDALGNVWRWSYDADGFPATREDPQGGLETLVHSASGDLLSRTDRTGGHIDYAYDRAHRLRRETWNTTPPTITSYTYDDAGRLTAAISSEAESHFTYDERGLLMAQNNAGTPDAPSLGLSIGRDENGNAVRIDDSLGGVTQYTRDELNRIVVIEQTGSGVVSKRVNVDYSPGGRILSLLRTNLDGGIHPAAKTTLTYDCGGACGARPTQIVHERPDGSAVLDRLDITRDLSGAVVAIDDGFGTHGYSYDAARRLESAGHPAAWPGPAETYGYDAVGNRTSSHLSAKYLYAPALGSPVSSQLLETDDTAFQYAADGALTERVDVSSGGRLVVDYDHRRRVKALTESDGVGGVLSSTAYRYDAFDQPIVAKENGVTRHRLYFGRHPVLETDESGRVVVRRLYGEGIDALLSEEDDDGQRWPLFDQVGTLRAAVHEDGTVDRFVTDSFGRLLETEGTAATVRFGGRNRIAPDIFDFRTRLYDARLGRFLQQDVFPPFGYDYGLGDPLGLTDPLGTAPLSEYGLLNSYVAGGTINVLTHTGTCKGDPTCIAKAFAAGGAAGTVGYGAGAAVGYAAGGLSEAIVVVFVKAAECIAGGVVGYHVGPGTTEENTQSAVYGCVSGLAGGSAPPPGTSPVPALAGAG